MESRTHTDFTLNTSLSNIKSMGMCTILYTFTPLHTACLTTCFQVPQMDIHTPSFTFKAMISLLLGISFWVFLAQGGLWNHFGTLPLWLSRIQPNFIRRMCRQPTSPVSH